MAANYSSMRLGEMRRLSTVLPWARTTRGLYHFDKMAHSVLIGLALWCYLPFRHGLVAAMIAGALGYLVVGKLTVGRNHHPAPWLEVLDWLSDLIIGLAGAAIAVGHQFGLELGLVAIGAWLLAYALVAYRWAVP